MADIIGALFVLLTAGIVFVVGGHVTWVAIAWVFRQLNGSSKASSEKCPQCALQRASQTFTCKRCGHIYYVDPVDAVTVASRVVKVHHNRGDIADEAHQQLQAALDSERRRLLGPGPSGAEAPPQQPQNKPTPAPAPPAPQKVSDLTSAPAPERAPEPAPERAPATEPVEAELLDVHPLDAPEQEPAVALSTPFAPKLQPRRKLADLLQAFMEDNNIRWGEIISGLLIVGCAVGLVISLRATLSAIPYFEAFLFMLGTAAIHATGIYTLRKWNLQSTSRAVLVIGMLLTPLNFLAAIMLSGSGEALRPLTDPFYLLAISIAVTAFGAMTYFASTALMRSGWPRLMLAVLGPSLAMLFINRATGSGMEAWKAGLLAAAPAACFMVASVWQLMRAGMWKRFSPARTGEIFKLFGLGGFALLAVIALIVVKDGYVGYSIAKLSPVISLAAAMVFAAGVMIHRRSRSRRFAATRTAGTAIAISGAVLMLMATGAAWPQADLLIATCTLSAAVLITLALLIDTPPLHAAGIACGAVAAVLLMHRVQPHFYNPAPGWEDAGRRIVFSLLMGRTSLMLVGLSALTAAAGVAMRKFQPASLLYYASGAGVLAVLALAVAGYAGFIPGAYDADLATITFVLAGAGGLGAAFLTCRKEVTWLAAAMLYLAMIHAADWNVTTGGWLEAVGIDPQRPVVVASLTHAILMTVLAAVAVWRSDAVSLTAGKTQSRPLLKTVALPLHFAAMVSAAATLPWTLYVRYGFFDNHAAYIACIAAVWLAAAISLRRADVFAGFQALATIAAGFAVLAVGSRAGWWNGAAIDMSFTSIQIAAAAIWCLAWTTGRRLAPRGSLPQNLLSPGWPAVDQVLLGLVTGALLLNALAAAWPGVYFELTAAAPGAWKGMPDFEYRAVYGPSGWIALLCVLAALAAALWHRLSGAALLALMLAGLAAPLMLAGAAEGSNAAASMLRWSLGVYCVLLIAAVCCRGYLRYGFAALLPASAGGFGRLHRRHATSTVTAGALICCGLPVLAITLTASVRALNGLAPGGPDEGSFFKAAGAAMNYASPLLMIAAALMALSFRERKPVFALATSAMLHLVVTLGYCLAMLGTKVQPGVYAVQLLEWHALTFSVFSLFWLAFEWRIKPRVKPRIAAAVPPSQGAIRLWADWPLRLQLTLGAATILLIGLIARGLTTLIYFDARSPYYSAQFPSMMQACGEWPSFAALGLMTVAFLIWGRKEMQRWYPHTAGAALICLVALLAAVSAVYDRVGLFLPFKVLTLGLLLVAFTMSVSGIVLWRRGSGFAVSAAGRCRWWALAVAGAPAFGAVFSSPLLASRASLHWWSVLLGVGLTVLAAGPGIARRGRLATYISTFIACFTAMSFFAAATSGTTQPTPSMLPFVMSAGCLMGIFWLVVQFRREQHDRAASQHSPSRYTVSQTVAVAASVLGLVVVYGSLQIGTLATLLGLGDTLDISTIWGVLFVASLGALLIVLQWDRQMKLGLPCLYAWGAMLLMIALDQWEDTPLLAVLNESREMAPRFTILMMGLTAGAYIAVTGYLWIWGPRMSQTASILGIDDPAAGLRRTAKWLPVTSLLLTAAVLLIEFIVVLSFPDRWMRILAGFAPVLAAIGLAMMAQQHRRRMFQVISLAVLTCGAVLLGWADITPQWGIVWTLTIFIRLLVVLGGMAGIYALLAGRIMPASFDWRQPLRWMSLSVAGFAAATLLIVLTLEAAAFGQVAPFAGAPVDSGQMIAVSAVLAILIVAVISMALRPAGDGETTRFEFRTALVYGAQAILLLLCVHFYLARPQWFGGIIRNSWPFIVLTIALCYAMLSELLQRLKINKLDINVLIQPFLYTGLALPLLPVAALWLPAEIVYSYAATGVSRPVVLVLAGVLYLFVSMVRKLPLAMAAGVLCGNLALWTLWLDTGLSLTSNPQFWLIPPAMSVLIAVQWNRRRLKQQLVTALRYSCVAIIYLSSTAEMLISSAEHSLWPPMVLMAVAVAGVFAGIMMRVRAFLFVSAFFVLLSIVSMVWHASRAFEHVWPWWAFGMGVGVSIMALFGLFELKRDEINALIQRLRKWEA